MLVVVLLGKLKYWACEKLSDGVVVVVVAVGSVDGCCCCCCDCGGCGCVVDEGAVAVT